tara:strand:- start:1793 stop:2272 length:480 start_codon:yes stop_codon:yes gene_type:complete
MDIRVGNGYDTHPLIKGEKLILGGIVIPHNKGIQGHSDGDALIHSIIDSLLGAISKRDIGYHFPSSKSEFKNISSFILLKEVIKKLSGENYKILNIDSTIILESPPISKFIDSMVEAISNEVGLNKNRISIKATTNDGLGFIGRGEGISVITTSLIIKD